MSLLDFLLEVLLFWELKSEVSDVVSIDFSEVMSEVVSIDLLRIAVEEVVVLLALIVLIDWLLSLAKILEFENVGLTAPVVLIDWMLSLLFVSFIKLSKSLELVVLVVVEGDTVADN